MSNAKAVLTCAIALSLLAASAAGQSTAPDASPLPSLPPTGLAPSETVQVNVANIAVSTSTGISASCTGSITFYNASGTAIGTPATFSLGTRQMFSAPVPYASTGGTGARTVVRAEIALMATVAGFGIPPCALASSIEVYDTTTGVTHAFAQGSPGQGLIGVIWAGTYVPAVLPLTAR
jgi:hypothetical protein